MAKTLDKYKGVILFFLTLVLILNMIQLRVKELNAKNIIDTNIEISYENN